MGRLIVSVDGLVYEVEHARVLSQEELAERKAKLQADLNELNQAAGSLSGATETPGTPAAAVLPAEPVAPAVPVEPVYSPQPAVGVDVLPAAPVAPVAPAEQVAPQPPILT